MCSSWPSCSPRIKSLIAFIVVYALVFARMRNVACRDPTSMFFNPDLGFERSYSTRREAEAHAFIDKWNIMRPYRVQSTNRSICVGIPTAQRANSSYFETTVGSVLAGLSPEERGELHVMPFIAHLEPQNHPAYHTSWLHGATDDVLIYDLSASERKYVDHLERNEKNHHKKSLVDYKYMLNACYKVGTPFVLILEDDVLAAAGWYNHLRTAIATKVKRSVTENTLYLRLFYTEKNFGWNREDWKSYLFYSALVESFAAGILLFLRRRLTCARAVTPAISLVVLAVCTPACILLLFATGRLTIFPFGHGLRAMDEYGCCSQALLYPREQIPAVVTRFEEELAGIKLRKAVDALIETHADENGLQRWAVVPSPFQHIGTQSGKQTRPEKSRQWGRTSAQRVWNFEFERWWLDHAGEQRLRDPSSSTSEEFLLY